MDLTQSIRERTFVIAEIGKNFIQSRDEKTVAEYLENAKALVRAAKDAGADAVKFQTHHVDDEQLNVPVVAPHFKGADRYSWVSRNTAVTPVEDFWMPLKRYCEEIGVVFFSTPMSRGAAEKLEAINVPFWKVGSGDLLDFVLLDYIAATKKPIILSTGMSTLDEIDRAVDFLKRRNAEIVMLHCVSKYPCPPEELRLHTIRFLKERYAVPVGFSDHSIGIDSALAAVALGARVIEKHFSFARDLWGSDHKVSMTPEEMRSLVSGIRELECDPSKRELCMQKNITVTGIKNEVKVLQEDEALFRPYFRKSLMAGADIPAGAVVTKEMLCAMRPQSHAGGVPSEEYERVLGKRAARAVKKYDPITNETFISA